MTERSRSSLATARMRDDQGLSIVVVAVGLIITALLVLVVAKTTLGGRSGPTSSGQTQPIAAADTTQAQQNLSTGLASMRLTAAGAQGPIDASSLEAANPSLSFTSGASTGPGTISVSASTDGASAALAAKSSNGTCWVIWWSPTQGTWFGAQTAQASCTAPIVSSAPLAGPVTSTSIGWQQGSFPPA